MSPMNPVSSLTDRSVDLPRPARSDQAPSQTPAVSLRIETHELSTTARVLAAKAAWTTRGLPLWEATSLVTQERPRTGDLVLARVTYLGQHRRLETPHGRRQTLFAGDEVVVAYGDRYAPDQYEAFVPTDLGPCQLVAGGGVAARVHGAHQSMAAATALEPLGLLARADGRIVSTRDRTARSATDVPLEVPRPVTVVVVGTAMNSGKTTSATALVRGGVLAGLRVGAAKLTGTGSGGDVWSYADAGAEPVLDFSDLGHVTTCGLTADELRCTTAELTDELHAAGCELVVLEIADGLYQEESAALVRDRLLHERTDAILLAAADALGGVGGLNWLRRNGTEPAALTGLLSASPLASREATAVSGLEVWPVEQLADPEFVRRLVQRLRPTTPIEER